MARLYFGSYGHNPSGKQYVYWGGDNYRTGQNVNVPVTHWKSGKLFNTMFTIQRTSGSEMGLNEASRLETMGIDVKAINGTDVMDLPGATPFENKTQWKQYSQQEYENEVNMRLGGFITPTDTAEATIRLLGE